MQNAAKRPLRSLNSVPTPDPQTADFSSLTVADIERHGQDWLFDLEVRQCSHTTIDFRRHVLEKLVWLLRRRDCKRCGTAEIRQFLAHATNGHREPGGRWGNPRMVKPASPRTIKDYYGALRTFFTWLVQQDVIEASPMARINPPIHRQDQIQPFTDEHVRALLEAAKRSTHPKRDQAILMLMLDTAVRASELCGLAAGDVNLDDRSARVLGKGRKERTVHYGRETGRALWAYLRQTPRDEVEPLFFCDRGPQAGQALTRSGLLKLFKRLGDDAGIRGVRCSPHTMRHYAAVSLIKNGLPGFSLQVMLGHTHLQQTSRYVAMAQADVKEQHRTASPGDRIKGVKRG